MKNATPWEKYTGTVPLSVEYPDQTLYGALRDQAERTPDLVAWDFLGLKNSYRQFLADVDRCAASLIVMGLKKGERATVCMPNTPQAIIFFYALSRIGAVASMIHPLSASDEILYYLKISKSKWALTLDAFVPNFTVILDKSPLEKLVVAKLGDYMGNIKSSLFYLTKGRKIKKVSSDERILWWKDFMDRGGAVPAEPAAAMDRKEPAVILYSGGTTGRSKGIMLSNGNFNALARQTQVQGSEVLGHLKAGDAVLAILPVCHGFGLAVCIHSFLTFGGKCILVPKFSAELVGKLIRKERPEIIAGVPTLYEALLTDPNMAKADMSNLKGAFAGGDKVPHSIKLRFDELLKTAGARVPLREGYGLTESVTVCAVMPEAEYRKGSVGIPYPDMFFKIVDPETGKELPDGEEGEICVTGPTVMLGYLDEPEETAQVLRTDEEGVTWLYTGDLGHKDGDGFIYFKLRLKRMIKVSGIAVYPTQIEEVIDAHPQVHLVCAVGVPDTYQIQKVKAFVVLKDSSLAGPAMEQELIDWCRTRINRWSCPREIEFREELPLTKVGKIAYPVLEQQELGKTRETWELQEQIRNDLLEDESEMLREREKFSKE
ncbi:MAG: AMP-binding protein [Spirochaetales bacterium]|nr:AMP-binding protein [Spirochaetales bacterium]